MACQINLTKYFDISICYNIHILEAYIIIKNRYEFPYFVFVAIVMSFKQDKQIKLMDMDPVLPVSNNICIYIIHNYITY